MKILLETPRLKLRQITQVDCDRLVQLNSDPEVMRYINGGIASTRAEITDKFLPDVLSYYQEYEKLGFWAVIEKSSQEFIGWVILRPESRFRLAQLLEVAEPNALELGYRLKKASWGRGYATEVAQAFINAVGSTGNYNKIIAWAIAENKASIRVMEKLGLKLEQEYCTTAADFLPNIELLASPVIQFVLGHTLVKYSKQI